MAPGSNTTAYIGFPRPKRGRPATRPGSGRPMHHFPASSPVLPRSSAPHPSLTEFAGGAAPHPRHGNYGTEISSSRPGGHDRRYTVPFKLFTWMVSPATRRLLSRRIWPGSIRRRSSQCPLVR